MRLFKGFVTMGIVLVLVGCVQAPKEVTQNEIDMLASEIRGLGPEVDPAEADRAAAVAYRYSLQLAEQYNVTDSPIIHNAKVNNGLRDRGICVHWAEDIEARLNQEEFRTLEIHRAIADGGDFRIDHSTSIISKRGDTLNEGIVLDPWRKGGQLFWSATLEDTRYYWEPRINVLERKYQTKLDSNKAAFAE